MLYNEEAQSRPSDHEYDFDKYADVDFEYVLNGYLDDLDDDCQGYHAKDEFLAKVPLVKQKELVDAFCYYECGSSSILRVFTKIFHELELLNKAEQFTKDRNRFIQSLKDKADYIANFTDDFIFMEFPLSLENIKEMAYQLLVSEHVPREGATITSEGVELDMNKLRKASLKEVDVFYRIIFDDEKKKKKITKGKSENINPMSRIHKNKVYYFGGLKSKKPKALLEAINNEGDGAKRFVMTKCILEHYPHLRPSNTGDWN